MKLTFNIFALLWLFFRMCLSQFKLIRYLFFCLKGGDSLVSKLTDKITGASSHKLILAHLPLIMVCIEVIFFIHLIFLKFTFCHVLKMVHKKLAPFGHTIQKLIQTYKAKCILFFLIFVSTWVHRIQPWDHPLKTSAFFRGGGVKNLPNLMMNSSKVLPTVGG